MIVCIEISLKVFCVIMQIYHIICNRALEHAIAWLAVNERRRLGALNPNCPRCAGIIDDTLVEIRCPWKNSLH